MAKATSDSPVGESTPARFGPYEMVRRLGIGGMAETFEAVRRGPGDFEQRICLKLVQPFYRDKRDFLELFEREARLAAQLRHSNIVGVIDFGRLEGIPYMALELVDGVDLATLLDAQSGSRLDHEQVALIGYQLAQALEHAHDPHRNDAIGASKAIIHRDLTPSNIMVSKSGEVLLTDFGVAKAIAGTAHQQSAVKGKVPYMSPEQLRAEPLDGRADLFALGVVLFEAAAGERPFFGGHDPSTIMKILAGERASLQSVAPGTPIELCDLIESLLEVDRDKRPQGAAEVIERLDPYLPASGARRELGAMASAARAEKLVSLESQRLRDPSDTSGIGLTNGEGALDARAPQTSPKERRAQRRTWPWVLVALLGAVAIWAVATRNPESTGERAPASDTESVSPSAVAPADEPLADDPPAATPETDDESKPTEDETTSAATRADGEQRASPTPPQAAISPARLQVTVFPWGDVWINGKKRGAAPLERVLLKPGRYRISAGQGKPSRTKRVLLKEGERRTVRFDLTE